MVTGPGLGFEENRRDGKVEGEVGDALLALGSGECHSGSKQGWGTGGELVSPGL